MKKITLLFLFFATTATLMFAQERFLDEVFDDVQITSNVPYGFNWTVLTVPVTGHSMLQPLVMDVYEPAGDVAATRPVILMWHTGNFLPIQINQGNTGAKTDSATVEICTRLAKLGYVVASCDYRLGWNPFGATQPDRAFSLINAAYRGVQDMRTAARYVRKSVAEDNNPFRIDTSRITMLGQGSGAYLSYAGSILDDYFKIPQTTMPAGKFLTDLDGDTTTLEPMIIRPWNGDIYGTSWGFAPTNGDTLCQPNHVGYSSDFDLAIQLGGAMADIGWLDQGHVPMISFHAPDDEFAPYTTGVLRVGTTGDAIVEVQGGRTVIETANSFGNNDVFNGVSGDEYSAAAQAASAQAGHAYTEGLYPFNTPLNMFNRYSQAPWEWWNVTHWDSIPHPSGAGSYHFVASLYNVGASRAKASPYIDTIIGYTAPRAFEALNLADWSAVQQIPAEEVEFTLAPNPASNFVNLTSISTDPILAVEIRDLSGRLMTRIDEVSSNTLEIPVGNYINGVYLTTVYFEKGQVNQRLVISK